MIAQNVSVLSRCVTVTYFDLEVRMLVQVFCVCVGGGTPKFSFGRDVLP